MTIRSKPDVREHQSFFGMPEDVKFCKKCTYSNQKPNSTVEFRAKRGDLKTGIVFSSGICSACNTMSRKILLLIGTKGARSFRICAINIGRAMVLMIVWFPAQVARIVFTLR